MEKINVAELLHDCPSGMELDCTMYENTSFIGLTESVNFPIRIRINFEDAEEKSWTREMSLTSEGKLGNHPNAKCIIFPKGKTTWEGFQRPFVEGDIVFYNNTIAIFKEWGDETLFRSHVIKYLYKDCDTIMRDVPLFGKGVRQEIRFATEEEKAKLFKAIKDKGYHWNDETKTLEMLHKFKVGDRIKDKNNKIWFVVQVSDKHFSISLIPNAEGYFVPIEDQDDYELVTDKFDISKLKPFDKVLSRDSSHEKWRNFFWGFYENSIHPFFTTCGYFKQCIPYEGNEHLLGTTNDCADFYKTWEK